MLVTQLNAELLDFWVAKSEGLKLASHNTEYAVIFDAQSGYWHPSNYHPSRNWSQGGTIVSNEWYTIETVLLEWFGTGWPYVKSIMEDPLKWFMRAYVASQFGNEVEEIDAVRNCEPRRNQQSEAPSLPSSAPDQPSKWPLWFKFGNGNP